MWPTGSGWYRAAAWRPYEEDLDAYRKMLLEREKPEKPKSAEAPEADQPDNHGSRSDPM